MGLIDRIIFLGCLLLSLCCSFNANAGSRQSDDEMHFAVETIASFAKKVERVAASKGARVFIVARVGSPPSELPPSVRFTHVGLAVYSEITTENRQTVPGYAIYNLYQRADDPDVSELITDYTLDFFAFVHELKAGIAIPNARLQRRLLKMIASGSYRDFHNPNYSILANPFNNLYQNCTEYTLDMINAAIYETDNREQIKVNALAYFDPQRIGVSPIKLLLGQLLTQDIKTADHEDDIEIATFTTIAKYLEKYGLLEEHLTVLAN